METLQLYMVLLGAKPEGRNIEQHDIFFGIASNVADLVPEMLSFWPETKGKMHIDAYRVVSQIDGYQVQVVSRDEKKDGDNLSLFFLNLGGYKPDEFEELHYKMLVIADDKAKAIKLAKETAFYQHTGFKNATSHIDDKYGVDVDDIFEIKDILSHTAKTNFSLRFSPAAKHEVDEIVLGYFPLSKLSR